MDELVGMIDSEWRRVLKPVGSLWLNLGDKYNNRATVRSSSHQSGLFPDRRDDTLGTPWADLTKQCRTRMTDGITREKSLLGLPWRVALALIDRGWILRAEVIWSKPNGLPESVTDRVRRSHEQWFHFVLEPQYFSAVDEIREPHTGGSHYGRKDGDSSPMLHRKVAAGEQGGVFGATNPDLFNPLGRLPGSVWRIATEPLIIPDSHREAFDLPDHFAAFPTEWPRRIIQGWSPSGVCVECGEGLLSCSYGTSTTTATASPPVRGVRQTDDVLLPETLGFDSEGTEAEPLLREGLRQSPQCEDPAEHPRVGNDKQGIHSPTRPGSPDGRQDGIRARASRRSGGEDWEDAGTLRGGAPHQRGAGRQSAGEPGTDDQVGSRQARQETAGTVSVSTLRGDDRIEGICRNCGGSEFRRSVILDPMAGTGTVPGVAHKLGRHGIGTDLSSDYCRLATWRIRDSGHFDKVTDRTWQDRQLTLGGT